MSSPAHSLPPIEEDQLWNLLASAEEIGLRLELTDTGITWEALPGYRHQRLTVDISSSIRPPQGKSGCGCFWAPDVAVRLPDGCVKRPDISIFCKEPIEEEGFIHRVPEAVIEITSPGYEDKDLISGPQIYLRNGVRDVLVLHRPSMEVHHWTASGRRTTKSPTTFTLTSGYEVTV